MKLSKQQKLAINDPSFVDVVKILENLPNNPTAEDFMNAFVHDPLQKFNAAKLEKQRLHDRGFERLKDKFDKKLYVYTKFPDDNNVWILGGIVKQSSSTNILRQHGFGYGCDLAILGRSWTCQDNIERESYWHAKSFIKTCEIRYTQKLALFKYNKDNDDIEYYYNSKNLFNYLRKINDIKSEIARIHERVQICMNSIFEDTKDNDKVEWHKEKCLLRFPNNRVLYIPNDIEINYYNQEITHKIQFDWLDNCNGKFKLGNNYKQSFPKTKLQIITIADLKKHIMSIINRILIDPNELHDMDEIKDEIKLFRRQSLLNQF